MATGLCRIAAFLLATGCLGKVLLCALGTLPRSLLMPRDSLPWLSLPFFAGTAYELLQAADILRPLAPDSPKVPGTAR
eukprot:SAG31_NODE_499_length_14841_cov_7.930471_4_plen_78_part_00